MNNKTRSPLIHVSKRGLLPSYKTWAIRGVALVLALVTCGLITSLVTGQNPIQVYAAIINGSFGSPRKIWVLLQNISMLLCISLAVTPAFRMRCWNLGAEGQALIGGLAAAACMILLPGKLPNWGIIACMCVASVLAGAVWAAIPAFFKAKWNTNETLFTLMMNYVATQLVAYYCVVWESPKGSGTIGVINANTVGESERTARYVGIKVDRVIIRTMLLSGAVCGLAGLLLVGSTNHTLTTTIVDGRGFTAVMVSWLAKFNPIWMILTSFLIVFLGRGSGEIATKFGLNRSFGDILTGLILFFIIGSEFFINYEIHFRKSGGKEG